MADLDDYQLELRGHRIGAGTDWQLVELAGLDEPDVRTSDRDRPRRHGAWLGEDLRAARTIVARLEWVGDSDTARWAAKQQLGAAWQTLRDGTLPLQVRVAGRTYLAFGRPRRFRTVDRAPGFDAVADVQFVAGDPNLYSAAEIVTVLTLGTVEPGFEFPLTFPLAFGGGTSGVTQLVNVGNTDVPFTVRFDGPLTSPRLEHLGRGATLTLVGDIPAGQWVDVDVDARTVLLGGTASRYEWVRGQWWDLNAGVNEIRFAANAGDGTATIRHRHGWSTPGP